MKNIIIIIAFICSIGVQAQVKTGIDVLKANNFKQLEGKRIGLVTNPTGVDKNLVSTIDILHNAKNVNLVALYGPEHGVRGDVHAGDKVDNFKDSATGLPVYSLYGKTRKPTKEMLDGIDVLVYDIQDNGCRSFTYISTLGMIMEAAAQFNKEIIVLDRPNPLGGEKVEGNLVEDGYISFVSQFKIPYLYGLTVGELANMLNGEKMLGKQCKLTVVPMQGWKREMVYADTKLPWVLPSPHIPQDITAYYYPISGILGELGYISIGVGYTLPFQIFCAEWINANNFTNALNSLNLPGIRFRPLYVKPFYATLAGENIGGAQVYITNYKIARLTEIQFYVMQVIAELYPNKAVFANSDTTRFNMFDKVSGSNYIRVEFSKRNKFSDIEQFWTKDEAAFKNVSREYYLYK
ncbi:MAG: DUF1343 domain-containing protein [Bacteroidales bacterium]